MTQDNLRKISLHDLAQGIRNLTPARGAGFAEAGAVCLDKQGHTSGVFLRVDGVCCNEYEVEYPPVTEAMRKIWKDLDEAAEDGASGIAILLMRDITKLTVVERSVKGTGFDYWLGPDEIDDENLIFQNKTRLEISGINHGSKSEVKQRVQRKLKQTERSDDMKIPGYVVVVEFGRPCSQVEKK